MCSELNDKYFRPKSTLLLVVAILNTGDAFSADDNIPFGLAPSVDSITPPSARQNKFDVQRMFMIFINLELRICSESGVRMLDLYAYLNYTFCFLL